MKAGALQRAAALALALQHGEVWVRVQNNCMAPALAAGARVRIAACSLAELQPGMIVLLRQGTRAYLHRYLGLWQRNSRNYLLCQSDNRLLPDPPWPAAALLGRAVEASPPMTMPPTWRLRFNYALARICGAVRPSATAREIWLQTLDRLWLVESEQPLPWFGDPRLRQQQPGAWPQGRIAISLGLRSADCSAPAGPRLRVQTLSIAEAEIIAGTLPETTAGLDAAYRLLAMKWALAAGGVALHASAVLAQPGQVVVFVGPSGAGKSAAAQAFPLCQKLDDDFVLLMPTEENPPAFVRIAWSPWRNAANDNAPLPAKAIILPRRGDRFSLRRLQGAAALMAILHRPPEANSAADMTRLLEHAARLLAAVPVYEMHWHLDEDLSQQLGKTLHALP